MAPVGYSDSRRSPHASPMLESPRSHVLPSYSWGHFNLIFGFRERLIRYALQCSWNPPLSRAIVGLLRSVEEGVDIVCFPPPFPWRVPGAQRFSLSSPVSLILRFRLSLFRVKKARLLTFAGANLRLFPFLSSKQRVFPSSERG